MMEEVKETSPSVVERDMSVVDVVSKDVDAVVGSSSSTVMGFEPAEKKGATMRKCYPT